MKNSRMDYLNLNRKKTKSGGQRTFFGIGTRHQWSPTRVCTGTNSVLNIHKLDGGWNHIPNAPLRR